MAFMNFYEYAVHLCSVCDNTGKHVACLTASAEKEFVEQPLSCDEKNIENETKTKNK